MPPLPASSWIWSTFSFRFLFYHVRSVRTLAVLCLWTIASLAQGGGFFASLPGKVDKFLFRLVNYLRPSVMWEIGTGSGMSTRYMAEAHADMQVYTFSAEPEDAVKRILSGKPSIDYRTGDCRTEMKKLVAEGVKPEIVHIAHTTAYKEVYEQLLPLVDKHTCFVIGTPYATPDKKKWWKEVIADPRTGVTFDLYDVGLVFFDKERVKEHRIVNFL